MGVSNKVVFHDHFELSGWIILTHYFFCEGQDLTENLDIWHLLLSFPQEILFLWRHVTEKVACFVYISISSFFFSQKLFYFPFLKE